MQANNPPPTPSPSSTSSENSAQESSTDLPPSTTNIKFDVNARDTKGLSLLFIGVVLGYELQVKRLLEVGADVSIFYLITYNLFYKGIYYRQFWKFTPCSSRPAWSY